MFTRFFISGYGAIAALLFGLSAPMVHANPLRSPFYYTTDESAIATVSVKVPVLTGTLFRDLQNPGPNLNGWVCNADVSKGYCAQTSMEKNAQPTRLTLRFYNKTSHSQYIDLPLDIVKTWPMTSCSLFAKRGVGINDVEEGPTHGDCGAMDLQISIPSNGLSGMLPGDWTAELQIPYMQANGGGYVQTRVDTLQFEIVVSDHDGANLFLDNKSLSFGSTPQSGATTTTMVYLYDPNHGTDQDTPLQLRLWDDYNKADRDPVVFSIITSFQQSSVPPAARLDYTVSLPALNLAKVINRQVYTIDLSHFPSWVPCPSAPRGEFCAKVPLSAVISPFLPTSKTAGPYKGVLYIEFGKSL